jgi:DNA-binding NarL/FixJ family response regulator
MRVVVADDHPVFRKGLIALLSADGIDVVGEAENGLEAIAVVARTAPDVVLMDLGMPELGGIEATERIVAADPGIRVIVITLYDDQQSVRAALAAGASGYVVKQAPPDEIVAAVRATAGGAMWIGSGVPRPGSGTVAVSPPAAISGLTPRENAIADLLSRGLSNPVIAERLHLSVKTVANYVSIILLKVGAADRAAAAAVLRDRRVTGM